MTINIFDLAGYTSNLFEYEPLNIFRSIYSVLFEKSENDWNNPILHKQPETPKPWVEYHRQSAINGALLVVSNLEFKDHWKQYHSWADKWNCACIKEDTTEWCYGDDNKSSEKCSQS